ncbi:hypothetical protein ACFQ9X_08160 [Catenulispora yoronensis]
MPRPAHRSGHHSTRVAAQPIARPTARNGRPTTDAAFRIPRPALRSPRHPTRPTAFTDSQATWNGAMTMTATIRIGQRSTVPSQPGS